MPADLGERMAVVVLDGRASHLSRHLPTRLVHNTGSWPADFGPAGLPDPAWDDGGVDLSELQANLTYLLNEWDPIGVADVVSDEYDCLLAPLLSRLSRGDGRSQISEFLWYELEDHFGLDPGVRDVDGMANRLVAWWAAVGQEAEELRSVDLLGLQSVSLQN